MLNFYFGVCSLPYLMKFYLGRFEMGVCVDWSHQGNPFWRIFHLKHRTYSFLIYVFFHYPLLVSNQLVWTLHQGQRDLLLKEMQFYFFVLKWWHHLLYTRWGNRFARLLGYLWRKIDFSIMILLLFLFLRCCVTDPLYKIV